MNNLQYVNEMNQYNEQISNENDILIFNFLINFLKYNYYINFQSFCMMKSTIKTKLKDKPQTRRILNKYLRMSNINEKKITQK